MGYIRDDGKFVYKPLDRSAYRAGLDLGTNLETFQVYDKATGKVQATFESLEMLRRAMPGLKVE